LRRIFVPVLMYHYISDSMPTDDPIRANLTVTADVFEEQLDSLQRGGYEAITTNELLRALRYGDPLPQKPILLTFDDGHAEHLGQVLPLLQRYGFSGTFFVITGFSDNEDPAHLSWPQVRRLADAGMEVASHTRTHTRLARLSYEKIVYELLGSQEAIDAQIGLMTKAIAYPIGSYDLALIHIMRTSEYDLGFSTKYGAYHDTTTMYHLPRIRVTNEVSGPDLVRIIESAR
jgi:peptidoglycan/xylan/chitin deacetylase (PgdA/CDA1 family)